MPAVKIPVLARGMLICQKVRKKPAPSISAASFSSRGMDEKLERRMNRLEAMELDRYEASTPMTPEEKRALRRWVSSGHSVKEAPPSKYPCAHCSYPPPDFLDVYRTDREIDREIKGMTEEEALSWLRENYGPAPECPEEEEECPENELVYDETPEEAHRIIRSLQRRIFHLCMFLAREGLDDEADEYLRTHMEEPAPFEDLW